jgi:hypothetical protein
MAQNQAVGNMGARQRSFMVYFSYTPQDQISHSVVVKASSREKAREKVLVQYPRAIVKNIIAI